MHSPGRRANILNPAVSHIGIGVHYAGNRIYATQNFMAYTVKLSDMVDGSNFAGPDTRINFKLNDSLYGEENVSIRVKIPESSAKWTLEGGRYYRCFGFLEPDLRIPDKSCSEMVFNCVQA